MKNTLIILMLMMSFEGISQNLPLSAGATYPLSGTLYHSGNSYVRRSLTPTYFGYSTAYRVLMLGSPSTTYTTQEEGSVTLSFGYDPSSNTNGAFTGDGREILFRNGVAFTTPNTANNGYHLNNLVLKDGYVGIGTSSPLDRLHLYTGPNPAYGTSGGITISDSYTVGRLWDSGGGHDIGTLDLYNDGSHNVKIVATGSSYINGGNVGIGTTSPSEKLSVNGNVRAKKIIVSQLNWPDYVFDTFYKLRPLREVEEFIKTNKRLPEMPSATEVGEQGISVGDNQALLLKKIEELTLYLIELRKENIEIKKQVQFQADELKEFKKRKRN